MAAECRLVCDTFGVYHTLTHTIKDRDPFPVQEDLLLWMSVPAGGPQPGAGPSRVDMEVTRNESQLFRAEFGRAITEMGTACQRMRSDCTKRLDQRVRDIQFRSKDLEWKLEEITGEVDVLLKMSGRLAKALEACGETLRVTGVCLEERMKRLPSERRHDEVDEELFREREVAMAVGFLLQRVEQQIAEQIRLNRSVQQLLVQDLQDKVKAENIDDSCASMTLRSIADQMPENILPSVAVTPEQWETTCGLNLAHAEQQMADSLHLRARAESVLERTATDVGNQVQATAAALQRNILELKSARSQMGDELAKVLYEFASQQRASEDLLGAVAENQGELRLARARLAVRRQRPSKEQCHDPAQSELLAEVQQLRAHIDRLREARVQSEEEQRALVRCQRELQENMEVKTSSLAIDEVVCARHREPLVIHRF
ncbi:tektin-1-like isoform 2-T2 [Spinachia spinachia]